MRNGKKKQRQKRTKEAEAIVKGCKLNDFAVHLSFANIAGTTASTSKFIY